MQNKAKEFLENNRAKEQQERNQKLIDLGFYDVVYPDENVYSNEFPEMTDGVYYKKVACEVTDKEYKEILRLYPAKSKKNKIAIFLKCFAYLIYLVGFYDGIVFAIQPAVSADSKMGFQIGVALLSWMIYLIFGTFFLGFSELLKLLNKINQQN